MKLSYTQPLLYSPLTDHQAISRRLADLAVLALIEEVRLTPKPALVDQRGSGAHADLTLAGMERSACALYPIFFAIAEVSWKRGADRSLREDLGHLGRRGEPLMLAATGGSNAHRGAIWALGLLISASVITEQKDAMSICKVAGNIASIPDRFIPAPPSHGQSAAVRFNVDGARGEAKRGFPHVVNGGLPTLRRMRQFGVNERFARLDALMTIMSTLDDTCLLHRAGLLALNTAKEGAQRVLDGGGSATPVGMQRLESLHERLMRLNASPGGAADMLSATLFVDWVDRDFNDRHMTNGVNHNGNTKI